MLESLPNVGKNLGATVSNLEWTANSKDLILLLVFAVLIFAHLFILRKNKIYSFLFSIYVSFVVVFFFPFHKWLSSVPLEQLTWIKVFSFLGLIIIFTAALSKARIFTSTRTGILEKFFKSILFGILSTGLLLSLLSTLLPLDFTSKFSGLSLNILTTDVARFVWIALPLVIFLFSIKLKKHRGPGRPPG